MTLSNDGELPTEGPACCNAFGDDDGGEAIFDTATKPSTGLLSEGWGLCLWARLARRYKERYKRPSEWLRKPLLINSL